VDLWVEECDDGNITSGDGCNQYCQIEETGSSDMCTDPDAVTFRDPYPLDGDAPDYGDEGSDTTVPGFSGSGAACPPGTVPVRGGITGAEAAPPSAVPQHPEYPGPNLGGTLKQFPASQRPPCGPGEVLVATGGDGDLGEVFQLDEGEVLCMPTGVCPLGPEAVRQFLATYALLIPGNWQSLPEDDNRRKILENVESFFCVNITEHNRPQSSYQMIEGCVDCHISAMVDAMEEALQTNVTPLKNTTNAFGISSAHGPAASFNLNTAVKSDVKYKQTGTAANAVSEADKTFKQSKEENQIPKDTFIPNIAPLARLEVTVEQIEDAENGMLDDIEAFNISSAVIPDQEVNSRVRPLLMQMKASFENIQAKYGDMANVAASLADKDQCE